MYWNITEVFFSNIVILWKIKHNVSRNTCIYNVHYLTTEIYDTYLISSSWFFFNSVVRVFFSSFVEFWRLLENKILLKKKDEDIKDVIRSHESKKDRQYNGYSIENKKTNTDPQNNTQKTKDYTTQTLLNIVRTTEK